MIADKPENSIVSDINVAWDNVKQGNFDEALRQARNISIGSQDYTESRLVMARIAWLQGFTEAAMAILDELAENYPDDFRVLTDLAVLQFNDGQVDKALGTLKKATGKGSSLPEYEIVRYAALRNLDRKEEADNILKRLHNKIF